jgi:hypothetical protein
LQAFFAAQFATVNESLEPKVIRKLNPLESFFWRAFSSFTFFFTCFLFSSQCAFEVKAFLGPGWMSARFDRAKYAMMALAGNPY